MVLWAYLLLHRRRPIPRDHLAYLLWPDTAETDARTNLRRHLHQLRKYLPDGEAAWIISTRKTVQWNEAAAYWLDVTQLEAFDGKTADSKSWNNLLKNSQGELLAGFYDEWILGERARLRQRYGRFLQ